MKNTLFKASSMPITQKRLVNKIYSIITHCYIEKEGTLPSIPPSKKVQFSIPQKGAIRSPALQ